MKTPVTMMNVFVGLSSKDTGELPWIDCSITAPPGAQLKMQQDNYGGKS